MRGRGPLRVQAFSIHNLVESCLSRDEQHQVAALLAKLVDDPTSTDSEPSSDALADLALCS